MYAAKGTLAITRRREIARATCAFMAPAIIFLLIFIVYPILHSLWLSLSDWSGYATVSPVFAGLSNWERLLGDGVFWRALVNNVKVVVLSILVQIPIGMGLGFLLDTGGRRLNFLKVAYFIPYLISSVAVGLLFRYALDPYFGALKAITGLLKTGSLDLLGNPGRAMYTVIGVICWQFTPFYMVYFLAGYSSMPQDAYEAAIIDGATRGKYFRYIVLPLLKPTVKNACILSLVGSLKYFDLIYVMTGGGPAYSAGGTVYGATELMATYMYKNAFTTSQMSYGSTVAMAMFLIVTAVSSATLFVMNREEGAP